MPWQGAGTHGNTRAARTLLAARRGQPAHVVGAYTLDIQEEEHGLHKTADCGAEQRRRKLRSRLPGAEHEFLEPIVQTVRAHIVGSGAASARGAWLLLSAGGGIALASIRPAYVGRLVLFFI